MDLSEALVDLLLVRLGREEERQRVVELLINELRLTREQARKAVDSTPTVLLEAVPMGQARVIQNRLYPFVDLLPRMDSVQDQEEEPGTATQTAEEPAAVVEEAPPPEAPAPVDRPREVPHRATLSDAAVPSPVQRTDDRVVVTTASEEMLSIERCHVCGRTPTGGEKLAPCRSCAELTCRDCFDRVAHVCQKCAADGKVVDTPLRRSTRTSFSRSGGEAAAPVPADRRALPLGRIAVIGGIVLVAALAVVFLVFDPFGVLRGGGGDVAAGPDSTLVSIADTSAVDSVPAPDSVLVDSMLLSGVCDSVGLASLPLPPGVPLEPVPGLIPFDTEGMPGELVALPREGLALQLGISLIAASVPVSIDRYSLFRLADSTLVMGFSILHPEEDNRRYDLLKRLGTWLAPTSIEELVFYYSENQYYPVRTVSFMNQDFALLRDAMGPVDFQNLASSSSESAWAVLTGPAQAWMARY